MGSTLSYTYEGFGYGVYSGIAESIQRGADSIPESCICSDENEQYQVCPAITPDAGTYNKHITYAFYYSVGVSEISSSNGQQITFEYEDIPGLGSETSEDKRVKNISIDAGDFTRNYNLLYETPLVGYSSTATESLYNPRYFLTEINYRYSGAPESDSLRYQLTYYYKDDLPSRLTFSQDLLGYYNGAPKYNPASIYSRTKQFLGSICNS